MKANDEMDFHLDRRRKLRLFENKFFDRESVKFALLNNQYSFRESKFSKEII